MIGNRTRVKVVKNKLAPPFKEVEFDILYGEGISKEGDLLDMASNCDVIQKSGTWYTYQDERIGQGRDNARNFLKERPEMVVRIREQVLAKHGVGAKKEAPAGATAADPKALSAPTSLEAASKAKAMAAATKAAQSTSKSK